MNKENKKQVIFAAILGVVLVGVLIYQFLIAGGPAAPTSTAANTANPAAAPGGVTARPAVAPTRLKRVDVDLEKLLKNVEMVAFIYENERTSRNPMTPLVGRINVGSQDPEDAGLTINEGSIRQKTVSGIIYNEFNPVAIIDDEVVTEGHQYADGVIVTQIEPKRVLFQWRDSVIPVELKEL